MERLERGWLRKQPSREGVLNQENVFGDEQESPSFTAGRMSMMNSGKFWTMKNLPNGVKTN